MYIYMIYNDIYIYICMYIFVYDMGLMIQVCEIYYIRYIIYIYICMYIYMICNDIYMTYIYMINIYIYMYVFI